jgi:hypothetical protein
MFIETGPTGSHPAELDLNPTTTESMFIDTERLHLPQPRQGLHVYRDGPTGSHLVKPDTIAASQMRPDVLSGRSMSINMQPLTRLGTSAGPTELQTHKCCRTCFLAAHVYKHATPDGVGNVSGKCWVS